MERPNFLWLLNVLFLELRDVDQTSTLSERLVDVVILKLRFRMVILVSLAEYFKEIWVPRGSPY